MIIFIYCRLLNSSDPAAQDDHPLEIPEAVTTSPETLPAEDSDVIDLAEVPPVKETMSASDRQTEEAEKFICKKTAKCKREFKTEKGLKTHIEICHTYENKIECQDCGKRFLRMQQLEQHQKIHMRPTVSCRLCDAELKTPFCLKQHMDLYHTKVQPECKICRTTFINNFEKRKHDKTCLKKENKLKFSKKNEQNDNAGQSSAKPQLKSVDIPASTLSVGVPVTTEPVVLPTVDTGVPVPTLDVVYLTDYEIVDGNSLSTLHVLADETAPVTYAILPFEQL